MIVGIFVGGQSRRMGGRAKGLLPAPDSGESLVARAARIAREQGFEVVLVGDGAAYAGLQLPSLADDPPGIGPIGGLTAFLCEAERRGAPAAIALACDLPYVTSTLLSRLASFAPEAAALAPRQDGKWQPLFARYAPEPALGAARAAIAANERALHRVIERLGNRAVELPLDANELELIRDWDEPGDVDSSG